MKLKDFRLENYEERSILQTALQLYKHREGYDPAEWPIVEALALRLSRTECQPGGCEWCNVVYTERDAFMDGVPWGPLQRMSDDEYARVEEFKQLIKDAEEGFDE